MMSAATWITTSLALLLGSAAAACETLVFDDTPFTVCESDPSEQLSRLWLNDAGNKRIGTFGRLQDLVNSEGQSLVWAMNAGMYHPDRRPVGLYVEDGTAQTPIVTREGPGNFGLLPNGVLCLSENDAAIVESRTFEESGQICRFATQSGPMLVIAGALHPRIIPGGTSKNIRNGVGVRADGTLVAAISDRPVNFDTFARLFRDELKTPNALYLDGRISRLYSRELDRSDAGFPMGPILGVVAPAD